MGASKAARISRFVQNMPLLYRTLSEEETMFETPKEIKPEASKGLWIGIVVAVAVVVLGGSAYFIVGSRGKLNQSTATRTAKTPSKPADPEHDLRLQSATMTKDRTGTTAVWLVTIENKSADYTYSNIAYETTYVGANNAVILVNKGTLKKTLAPGDEENSEINDVLYPNGTAWYKFRITGASASTQ
jgi:hypothetical protein